MTKIYLPQDEYAKAIEICTEICRIWDLPASDLGHLKKHFRKHLAIKIKDGYKLFKVRTTSDGGDVYIVPAKNKKDAEENFCDESIACERDIDFMGDSNEEVYKVEEIK